MTYLGCESFLSMFDLPYQWTTSVTKYIIIRTLTHQIILPNIINAAFKVTDANLSYLLRPNHDSFRYRTRRWHRNPRFVYTTNNTVYSVDATTLIFKKSDPSCKHLELRKPFIDIFIILVSLFRNFWAFTNLIQALGDNDKIATSYSSRLDSITMQIG